MHRFGYERRIHDIDASTVLRRLVYISQGQVSNKTSNHIGTLGAQHYYYSIPGLSKASYRAFLGGRGWDELTLVYAWAWNFPNNLK